jgi:kynurenine formamidase
MRETFELLGRRMTVLDLTRSGDARSPGTVAVNRRLPGQGDSRSSLRGPSRASGLPLRWLMGDGVLLDLSKGPRDPAAELAHCRAQLDRAGYRLKPYDIVLCRFEENTDIAAPVGRGLSAPCLAWMLEQGVRVIGSNGAATAEALLRPSAQGRSGMAFCSLDGLCNLERLPGLMGFTVMALPVDHADPANSTSRVVALFDGV